MATLVKRIHKPVQFYIIMYISRERYLPGGYYDLILKKQDDLHHTISSFVKVTNFNMTKFFTRKNFLEARNKSSRNGM